MKRVIKNIAYRSRLVLASVLLLGAQALAPVSLLVPTASAAVVCTNDQQGANDEPGQKDLTLMCYDGAGLPTSVSVSWQWDEIAWSGNNTGDGCALFDSDNDGKANYSFCVIVGGDPAAQLAGSPKVYSCNDSRTDRCSGKQLVNKAYTSTCSVVTGTDPFAAGTGYPSDTRANCTVNLSDFSTGSAPTNAVLKDVCSYPSQEPNSDPSDCVVTSTSNNTTIELIKQIVPESDSGKFNLKIRKDSSSGTTLTSVANAQDNYTTGVIEISPSDDVVLEETAGTSTSLSNYNTTLVCVKQNGNPYTFSNSTLTGATRTAEIDDDDIFGGDNITCTFTNTRQQATLILQKTVVNDNGGQLTQSSFPVAIDGNAAQWGNNTVTPGTYTVSETQQPGYTAGNWGGDCTAAGSVTLTDGQTKTCTITNDDQPGKLIVKKVVVNDNGGGKEADDFSFTVNGGSATAFEADGQNDVTVNAGTYDVAETAVTGYATTYENCEDVEVAIGETETCTITNDDIQPKLTVTKVVTNNDGGQAVVADFPLFVDATGVTSGVQNGFNAGNYTISETNKTGYAATITGDCAPDGTITLHVGDVKSCTITNDDIAPIITVVKYVTNDDGGLLGVADFALFVGLTQVTSGVANPFAAGGYTVSETNKPGYTASAWGGDCAADGTIQMTVGGNYTCTITNDDQPGKLVVKKVVVNDDGGAKESDDFSFSVNSGQTVSFEADGQNDITVGAGKYSVAETAADGYTTSYENCTDVAVANGETETCTITNDDIAPTLKIVKKTLPESDQAFTFTSDELGSFNLSGGQDKLFEDLQAGSYTVTESATDGWKLVNVTCEGATYSTEDNFATIRLAVGDEATCEFTNEKLSAIDGYKFEDVNIDGDWAEGEPTLEGWTITLTEFCLDFPELDQLVEVGNCENAVEATTVTDENGYYRFGNLDAGTYIVCEEIQDGWVATFPLSGYEINCHFIELGGAGDEQQADFGNFQKATVEGSKFNDVNGNHAWDENENGLQGWEITLTKKCVVEEQARIAECEDETWTATTGEEGAYSFPDLLPGEYTVCETQKDKWAQTFPETEDGCHEFVIDESGQAVVADFGNKAKPQVLAEETKKELVNTGSPATTGLVFGLSLLGLTLLTLRRKEFSKTK